MMCLDWWHAGLRTPESRSASKLPFFRKSWQPVWARGRQNCRCRGGRCCRPPAGTAERFVARADPGFRHPATATLRLQVDQLGRRCRDFRARIARQPDDFHPAASLRSCRLDDSGPPRAAVRPDGARHPDAFQRKGGAALQRRLWCRGSRLPCPAGRQQICLELAGLQRAGLCRRGERTECPCRAV